MKRVIAVLAALAFSLSLLAQDTSKPSDNQSQSNQAGQSSQSSQTNPSSTSSQSSQTSPSSTSSSSGSSDQDKRMSGKVSKDAKTFTDDTSGKSYTVSNPDSL